MKKFLAVVVFCLPAFGQATYSGQGLYSGSGVYGVSAGAPVLYAALPQVWVDNNELTCGITSSCYAGSPGLSLAAPAYELTLGSSSWISGAPPSYCTFSLPYAATASGEQAAVTAMEACRTAGIAHSTAIGIVLDVPPGVYTSTNGIVIPQSSGTLANAPLIVRSTYDSTLAGLPEPVGAGGIQDNLSTSTNPGLNNPDLTGTNMYFENGPTNGTGTGVCATAGVICGITTVSVNTTTLQAIGPSGSPQLVYLANGYVSPTLASGAGCLQIDSECVTPQSGPNQVGIYAVFGSSHSYGAAITYSPNAGVSGCTGSGTFQLANGTCKNISAYNYLQYMPQLQCSSTGCLPLQLCTAGGMGLPNACTGTIGPDHWQFQDLAISLCPGPAANCAGSISDQFLVDTGQGATKNATSYSQYAQHIHFRRVWAHGDWTSLSTGVNSVADGIHLEGCYYCSVVGSQVSQAIRPGSEGHSILANGNTLKINNNWFEGSSSGMFIGGESAPPEWLGYYSGTDVEFRRNRDTFPYAWLGFQCPDVNGCGNFPNNNPYYGGANSPWITGNPTMVYISGSTMYWVSGDPFHDSTSNWPGNPVKIGGNSYNLAVAGSWTQTCGSYCYPSTPPTTIPLKTSCSSNCGTLGSPVPFIMNQSSLVRKNCNEFKEGARILFSGITCENTDNSGGQQGINFTNATRSVSGSEHGAIGADYGVQIKDITVQGSIFRNSCNGFTNAGGRSLSRSGGVSLPQQRMSFTDVLGYGITTTNPGCPTGAGYGARLDTGGQSWNVTISGNGTTATATAFASIDAGVSITGATYPGTGGFAYTDYTTTGNTAAQNAALCGGTAGAYIYVKGFGDGNDSPAISGFPCTASSATSITLANSSGVTESGTATGNPILAANAYSDSATTGFQAFDILPGDPIYISGCTGVTGFNMPTQTIGGFSGVAAGIGPPATSGSASWTGDYTGWTPAEVQVSYAWATSGTDNTGNCILTNTQGSPQNLIWNHLTQITDATEAVYPLNTPGNGGPNFQINHAFLNSIFLSKPGLGTGLGGWYNGNTNSPHEGTNTEEFNYDVTSLSTYGLVLPGRTSSAGDYTEFPNNPSFPEIGSGFTAGNHCTSSVGIVNLPCYPSCANGINTVTGCSAPTSNWSFPSTSCSIGFVYSCSGNLPLVLSDYHQYALSSGSAYHNASPDDGTDIGARIPAIDTAQTLNQFVCATSCGSPGPFPD